jgi:hypothetical protein
MRYSHRTIRFVILLALLLAVPAGVPTQAGISVELAKKCRALMVRAHPSILFGRTGTAAAQRAYFGECVRRNGNMSELGENTAGPAAK